MLSFVIHRLIKDSKEYGRPEVKSAYASVCSGMGILINIVLCAGKIFCGMLSGSTAIVADGVNNLVDVIIAVTTYVGVKIASLAGGSTHPFGHGRFDWIMSSFSSIFVIGLGIQLVKSSLEKALHPVGISFTWLTACILLGSIAAKYYMYRYNKACYERVKVQTLETVAADSISDMISTICILGCALLQQVTGWELDGWCGLAVSAAVIYSGAKALTDAITRILGKGPDPELAQKVERICHAYPVVSGVHGLNIHDYGMGNYAISLHIESEYMEELPMLNQAAWKIERDIYEKTGCDATIQVDVVEHSEIAQKQIPPIVSKVFDQLKVNAGLKEYRMSLTNDRKNIELTIACPHNQYKRIREIKERMVEEFVKTYPDCYVMIHFQMLHNHTELT